MSIPTPILKTRSRIAVIGAGISGLGAAWALRDVHDVTVFEKRERLGGHANTVTIDYDGTNIDVDTGFIVFNQLNYPNLTALFEYLKIETFLTDMSFGFSLDGDVEWSSNGLSGLFAQKRNLFRPSFVTMLGEVLRFNKQALKHLEDGSLHGLSLGDYLDREGFSQRFRMNYLLPMGAAIWSSTEDEMAHYPAEAFVRFFKNHRLVNASRPQWETVKGGSRQYVMKLTADLETSDVTFRSGAVSVKRENNTVYVIDSDGVKTEFDEGILACHSDQALKLLEDPSEDESAFLGAITYAPNVAVLHRDTSLLPRRKNAHAAWCYLRHDGETDAAVTYDMNRLQGIDKTKPLLVTLNPSRDPDPDLTFGRFEYDHPQFNTPAMASQRIFNQIQGVKHTWFAGAWLGYGFHEDGLRAGLRAALRLGGQIPWTFADGDISGGEWGPRGEAQSVEGFVAAE